MSCRGRTMICITLLLIILINSGCAKQVTEETIAPQKPNGATTVTLKDDNNTAKFTAENGQDIMEISDTSFTLVLDSNSYTVSLVAGNVLNYAEAYKNAINSTDVYAITQIDKKCCVIVHTKSGTQDNVDKLLSRIQLVTSTPTG